MKLCVIGLLFLCSLTSSTIDDVRGQFPYIKSYKQAANYILQLENNNSPESKAYLAAMYFMQSKYVKFPVKKFSYFKKGKKKLDNVINENPNNIEFRYIRFLMQNNVPDFLGYNSKINEDFVEITNQIKDSKLSISFKKKILTNMSLIEKLNAEKKQKLIDLKQQL